MTKSFREAYHIYLKPNGIIKEEGEALFLSTLPSTKSTLKQLFREWYGPNVKWKSIISGIFTGDSGDSVIRITAETEVYFFKLFSCTQRALREYLAYLYITEWNLPLLKHAPIVKMGKIIQKDGQERIYLVSKMARGSKGIDYIRGLLKKEGDIGSLKAMLKTLGTAMSTMHKQESYSFSEEELSTYFTRWIKHIEQEDSPFIIKKFSEDPLLSTFHNDLQKSLQTFVTHQKAGSLSIGLITLSNFSFLPENGYIELFDQGQVLFLLTSNGNCYVPSEIPVIEMMMSFHLLIHFQSLCISPISHLKNRFPIFRQFRNRFKLFFMCRLFGAKGFVYPKNKISQNLSSKTISSLRKTFLNAYYTNGFPTCESFYEKADIWIRIFFLYLFTQAFRTSDNLSINLAKHEYTRYQNDPKAYLKTWFD